MQNFKYRNGKYIIESIYGYRGHNNFEIFDKDYHLWTIEDAKDGDVLITRKKQPFIFKNYDEDTDNVYAYCGITDLVKDNSFYVNNEDNELWTCCSYDNDVQPATKEQRDLLFTKMKEAGYKWDAENKEPKKIENVEIPFGAKDSELQEATYFIPKGFHAEINDDKVVIKKGEKPTAWSEEDEEMLEDVRDNFEYNKGEMTDSLIAQYDKFFDKIKFLKPQSKQKWSEEDDRIYYSLLADIKARQNSSTNTLEAYYNEQIDWLKSLKDKCI